MPGPNKWDHIQGLGSVGIEPDLNAQSRNPNSLDIGHNVRAIGDHLANAGGFTILSGLPLTALPPEPGAGGPTACVIASPPDEHTRYFQAPESQWVDRSYCATRGALQAHCMGAFPLQLGNEEYDISLTLPFNLTWRDRLKRIQINALNSGGVTQIQVLEYDENGIKTVHLDYDCSTELSDQNMHWIFWRFEGDTKIVEVYLDSDQLFFSSLTELPISFYSILEYSLTNYGGTHYIPYAQWTYGASIWNCLTTTGQALSLQGLPILNNNPSFRVDPDNSSVDLWIPDNKLSVSGIGTTGTSQPRNGQYAHRTLRGRIYFEAFSYMSESNASWRVGGKSPSITLGTDSPGDVPYSFGYQGQGGDLLINGNVMLSSPNEAAGWAIDVGTGETWVRNAEAANTWYTGADPDNGDPAPYNIYNDDGLPSGEPLLNYGPLQLCMHVDSSVVGVQMLSGDGAFFYSDGAPDGFSYVT